MSGSTVLATMAYAYNADGQLTSASDPNSDYAFTYDHDGNALSTDNYGTPNVPHVVLTSGFDVGGDRTSLSATIAGTADFLNNYTYDADQNLTKVTQQDQTGGNIVSPKEIDYAYNALGQFTLVTAYNTLSGPRTDVLTGAYTYDSGDRLTGLAYTSDAGANTNDTLGWGYDAASNVTSFSSIDGTASYGYDSTNQLTSATYTTSSGGHQPSNESYSFDANGNRDSTGYSTGSDNLMTSDGTFNYTHDADGNTTSRTRISSATASDYLTTYTWDYRNRLTDVEYYNNSSVLTKHVHFVYDVFDHLLATDVDSTGSGSYDSEQHYVLDVSPEIPSAGLPGTALAQPILMFDGSGNLIGRNLVSLDPAGVDAVVVQGSVSSTSTGDTDIWLADDNLGTPRDGVDSTGTLVKHEVYTAFGRDIYDSDPSLSFWVGFGGGHFDPNTGLVNDYERWYNPATGTWESQDPAGFAASDANLERYVGNSPTDAVDPTGLVQSQSPVAQYGQTVVQELAQMTAQIAAAQQQVTLSKEGQTPQINTQSQSSKYAPGQEGESAAQLQADIDKMKAQTAQLKAQLASLKAADGMRTFQQTQQYFASLGEWKAEQKLGFEAENADNGIGELTIKAGIARIKKIELEIFFKQHDLTFHQMLKQLQDNGSLGLKGGLGF